MPVCLRRAVISTHISVGMGWLQAAEALWWSRVGLISRILCLCSPCTALCDSCAAVLPLPGATPCLLSQGQVGILPSFTHMAVPVSMSSSSFFSSPTAPTARTAPTVLVEEQPSASASLEQPSTIASLEQPSTSASLQHSSATAGQEPAECVGNTSPLAADYWHQLTAHC